MGQGLLQTWHKPTPGYLSILPCCSSPHFAFSSTSMRAFLNLFLLHTIYLPVIPFKKKKCSLIRSPTFFMQLLSFTIPHIFLLWISIIVKYLTFILFNPFVFLLYHKLYKNQTISHTTQTQSIWQLPNEYSQVSKNKTFCFLITNLLHNIRY